jgi:hypothetical protein
MPFTPFHLGPGVMMKARAPRRVSLNVLALTQVLIDLEPLSSLLAGEWHVLRLFHRYLGVTGVVVLHAWMSPPVCQWTIRWWNRRADTEGQPRLAVAPHMSRGAAVVGAALGGYSHVFLANLIHADLAPWAPFAATNGLLFAIDDAHLHLLCGDLGLVGLSLFTLGRTSRGRSPADPE